MQEGQRVKAGQFLLEIDPRSLEGQLQRGEAGVAAAQSGLQQARVSVEQSLANLEQSQANLSLARQNLKRQEELWKGDLTSRETLEKAQSEVAVREADVKARERLYQGPEQKSGRGRSVSTRTGDLATTNKI